MGKWSASTRPLRVEFFGPNDCRFATIEDARAALGEWPTTTTQKGCAKPSAWWPPAERWKLAARQIEAAAALEVYEAPPEPLASRPPGVHRWVDQRGEVGGPVHGRRQSHHRPEAVVQEDFDAFQKPPPVDLPAAWIFQVPHMDLPETGPE